MPVNLPAYSELISFLQSHHVTLVAVSKTKPVSDIQEMYHLGQRDFGENYVQELVEKQALLPADIRWHFIGHLQSNKVKYIIPFVHLIQGIDSLSLLKEVNKQASKHNRVVNCLLQIYIAKEESKFGMDEAELEETIKLVLSGTLPHVSIQGLMGMASFTNDTQLIKNEFAQLKKIFDKIGNDIPVTYLSMGMSSDYKMAIEQGSNMVRIGSMLFGTRNK